MAPARRQDRSRLLVHLLIRFREKARVLRRRLLGILPHRDAKFDFAAALPLFHGIKRKLSKFIGRICLCVSPLRHGAPPCQNKLRDYNPRRLLFSEIVAFAKSPQAVVVAVIPFTGEDDPMVPRTRAQAQSVALARAGSGLPCRHLSDFSTRHMRRVEHDLTHCKQRTEIGDYALDTESALA